MKKEKTVIIILCALLCFQIETLSASENLKYKKIFLLLNLYI